MFKVGDRVYLPAHHRKLDDETSYFPLGKDCYGTVVYYKYKPWIGVEWDERYFTAMYKESGRYWEVTENALQFVLEGVNIKEQRLLIKSTISIPRMLSQNGGRYENR